MRTDVNSTVEQVTQRIARRSQTTRAAYEAFLVQQKNQQVTRARLSCGNLAHGFAACQPDDKQELKSFNKANIGIINAYNDMLSAHQPYQHYPDIIKQACRDIGSVAQVAAGVPAMCDGVTQGQAGMELSLLSRDVIAMSTAIGFSHQMFDGGLLLGICDKIVPGLLIGALSFGHLPMLFVPAGPMASGLSNPDKAKVRQQFAEGRVGREALLAAEAASYHSHGTCTFYGTANSNQLVMEVMGLQLPGSSFVHPDSPLRLALTQSAAQQACRLTADSGQYTPLGQIVTVKAVVNGLVALLATGGSTNLTIHLIAIAKAAGIDINWDDFGELSQAVPLLAKVYPNGQADINHFHAAGGVQFLIRTLLDAGLLHGDVATVAGFGLARYTQEPKLLDGVLSWTEGASASLDTAVLRPTTAPFQPQGGLSLLTGNLGRAVIKVSAVQPQHQVIVAPALVINDQNELQAHYEAGRLDCDCVVVVRGQGPQANGMPELHKLLPILSSVQDQGHQVALVTDGRMSGASGKVACAIHVTPEAVLGGAIGRIQDQDIVHLNAQTGELKVMVSDAEMSQRVAYRPANQDHTFGVGRELFQQLRRSFTPAEQGARTLSSLDECIDLNNNE